MDPLRRGTLLMAASGLSFGSLTIFTKLAYAEGTNIPSLLAVRFGVAAVALLPLALAVRAGFAGLAPAVALGAVGYTATTALFFLSLETLPAGVAAFLLYLAPIPVSLLAWLLLRERPARATLGGLALGLAGLAGLTLSPGANLDPTGVVLAVGSALAYAGTILAGRHIVGTSSPYTVATGVCAGAAIAWTLVGLGTGDLGPLPSAAAWVYAATIALLCTALAVGAFYAGLALVGASRAAVISMVEPLTAALLGALVLGETLAPLQLAGGALLLGGVVLASR